MRDEPQSTAFAPWVETRSPNGASFPSPEQEMHRLQHAALVSAMAVVAHVSAPQDLFRDPAGRFTLMVPSGWRATPQGGGVVITNGNVMAMFSPFSGVRSGNDVVAALNAQYGAQWRDLRTMDQGTFSVAGRPTAYAVYSGTNPRGVPSILRLAGLTDSRDGYAIVMSAPQSEFNAASQTLQALEQSFTLADAGGAGPAPAPVPGPLPPPMQGGGALGIRGNGMPPNGGMPNGPVPNGPVPNGGAPSGRATLGVYTRNVEAADLPRIGIKEQLGALIEQVAPGSAAERAGLVPGDVILSADQQTIRQHTELQRVVQSHRPGESVSLILMRGGRPLTLAVTLR